jgi:hypothetical protein
VDIANISDRNLRSQVLQVVTPRGLVFGHLSCSRKSPLSGRVESTILPISTKQLHCMGNSWNV